MPPPPVRGFNNANGGIESNMSMTSDMMMQRLSLSSLRNAVPSWNSNPNSSTSMDEQTYRARMRPSSDSSNEPVMAAPIGSYQTNYSGYNNGSGFYVPSDWQQPERHGSAAAPPGMEINFTPDDMLHHQKHPSYQHHGGGPPPPPPPAGSSGMGGMSPMMASPSIRNNIDRRRHFAKLKYDSKASSGAGSSTDGMPDIHMLDSTHSLQSNFSDQMAMSNHSLSRPRSKGGRIDFDKLGGASDHGMKDADSVFGLESRRSLMSNLSRISDHSAGGISMFSDLSRKVSTGDKISGSSIRSMAMSEISGSYREKDDDFDENDDGFFSYEYKPQSITSSSKSES